MNACYSLNTLKCFIITKDSKFLNVLTVPNTSVNEFVNLLQQQTIMNSLKPATLSESSVGASLGCVRSKESYLYDR